MFYRLEQVSFDPEVATCKERTKLTSNRHAHRGAGVHMSKPAFKFLGNDFGMITIICLRISNKP